MHRSRVAPSLNATPSRLPSRPAPAAAAATAAAVVRAPARAPGIPQSGLTAAGQWTPSSMRQLPCAPLVYQPLHCQRNEQDAKAAIKEGERAGHGMGHQGTLGRQVSTAEAAAEAETAGERKWKRGVLIVPTHPPAHINTHHGELLPDELLRCCIGKGGVERSINDPALVPEPRRQCTTRLLDGAHTPCFWPPHLYLAPSFPSHNACPPAVHHPPASPHPSSPQPTSLHGCSRACHDARAGHHLPRSDPLMPLEDRSPTGTGGGGGGSGEGLPATLCRSLCRSFEAQSPYPSLVEQRTCRLPRSSVQGKR